MSSKADEKSESQQSLPIGLIGLGLMGSAIAESLLKAGHAVLGFDVRPDRVSLVQSLGGEAAQNVTHVARRCQRIILSLFDHQDVCKVLAEIQGELRPGQIIIDTTTGDADWATQTGRQLASIGVSYLDAAISGNRDQLLSKEAAILAGGPAAAFRQSEALLRCLAPQVYHVGEAGYGARMKLVTNLVLGLNRAALAEGLIFAEQLGLDWSQTLQILQSSPASSRIMNVKGEKMIHGDFTPQARLSQHLKDVRLMIEAARRTGQMLPLTAAHREILERAEKIGLGELDNSAILKAIASYRDKVEGA